MFVASMVMAAEAYVPEMEVNIFTAFPATLPVVVPTSPATLTLFWTPFIYVEDAKLIQVV